MSNINLNLLGGGVTQLLPRDGGTEKLHEDF